MVLSRSHKFSSNDSKRFVNPSFGDGKSLPELASDLLNRVLSSWDDFFSRSRSSGEIDSKKLSDVAKKTIDALSDFEKAFDKSLN